MSSFYLASHLKNFKRTVDVIAQQTVFYINSTSFYFVIEREIFQLTLLS